MLALDPGVALDIIGQQRIAAAWIRRKRLEARLIALEVGQLLAAGVSWETNIGRIPGHQMLWQLGIEV